jgi:hypothetical protein
MIESSMIPKQSVVNFFNDLNVPCVEPVAKLNAMIDIMVPGRRKFCYSKIEFYFYDKYVVLKLLNKGLYPAFPIKFDSRDDLFLAYANNCFCLEGYSCLGKHKLNIFPLNSLLENYVYE